MDAKHEKTPKKPPAKTEPEIWDVAIIGGGPAGMMAAGRAAERLKVALQGRTKRDAKVILLEKNDSLGKKLLITGGGRCNVTNAELDTRKLLAQFKDNNKYLFSAFSQWSVKETLDFFHGRRMDTKTEALQRVFPASNSAQSVWDVLVEYMRQGGVTVRSNSEVTGFEIEGEKIVGVNVTTKATGRIPAGASDKLGTYTIRAKEFILATGGKSRPETGSTGDGFAWLKKIGHTIVEPDAALVPIAIKEARGAKDNWYKRLQGVALSNAKITLFQNGIKQASAADPAVGRILFTHFGLSGPTILNMSRDIGELLKYGDVLISLDLLPELDYGELNLKLQDIFKKHSNKKFKNSLAALAPLVPSALAPVIVELSGIDPETWSHSVTREQRIALTRLLKAIPLHVESLLGVEKAVVTSGGVALDEIDFKSMLSRLFPNLFLIGDLLNINRPSGGYSLQLCWTTGFVAGNSVEVA